MSMYETLAPDRAVGRIVTEVDWSEHVDWLRASMAPDPTLNSLRAGALAVAQADVFLPLTELVLSDQDYLKQVQARSYQLVGEDANGQEKREFIYINLMGAALLGDLGPDMGINVWLPEDMPYYRDDIHGHSRSFGSAILTGEVWDAPYCSTTRGEHRLQAFAGYGTAEPLGLLPFHRLPKRRFEAGEVYSITPSTVHRTLAAPRLTATVNHRGSRLIRPLYFLEEGQQEFSTIEIREVDVVEILRRVRKAYRDT